MIDAYPYALNLFSIYIFKKQAKNKINRLESLEYKLECREILQPAQGT